MAILSMAIGEYCIGGYWWLLMIIISMAIGEYFISGYFISGYW